MSYTREECDIIAARYASRRTRGRQRLAAQSIKVAAARAAGESGFWSLYLGAGTVDDLRAFRGLLPRPLNMLLPDMAWGPEHSQMGDTVSQLARAMIKGTLRDGKIDGGRGTRIALEDARAIVARVARVAGELGNAAAARRRLGPVAG